MSPAIVVEKEVDKTSAAASKAEKRKINSSGDTTAVPVAAKKAATSSEDTDAAKQAKQDKLKAQDKPEARKEKVDVYKEILSLEARESEERPAEEDNQLFKQVCDQLRKLMKEIFDLKMKKAEKAEINEKKIQATLLFVNMKKLNRLEKLRIRTSRERTAASKQNVDAFNLQLQNLRYEVLHLRKEVSRCLNFRSSDENIELVPVDQFYREADPAIAKPESTQDDAHAQRLARLAWELETRKKLESQSQELEDEKNKMEEVICKKDDKLRELGPHLLNIVEASKPVQEFFELPMDYQREQNNQARLLPDPLYVLYTRAKAYGEASDMLLSVEVEGDADAAANIRNKVGEEGSDEDEEEEEERSEQEGKKKHRGKGAVVALSKPDPRRKKILKEHPLHVILKIKTKAGDEIELKMRYLLMLGIVTAQAKLHLKDPTLAAEAGQASSVLNQLYEADDGQSSPNLKNEHQLKEAGLSGDLSKILSGVGTPYIWAQRLAGLDFLTSGGQAEKSISFLHMEKTICAIRSRLESWVQLQSLLSGLERTKTLSPHMLSPALLAKFPHKINSKMKAWSVIDWEKYHQAKMTAAVVEHGVVDSSDSFYRAVAQCGSAQLVVLICVKTAYPSVAPVFSISLNWDGEKNTTNCDWLRDLEREANLGWTDIIPEAEADGQLLALMLYRLLVLLDVVLESVSSSDKEFPKEKEFSDAVRGRMRSLPLAYSSDSQTFHQR